jgi:hypothetical protein
MLLNVWTEIFLYIDHYRSEPRTCDREREKEVQNMAMSLSRMKFSSILGATAAIFALDSFFLTYMTSKGFYSKAENLMIGSLNVSVPLQWLPVFGVVILSLVTWYEAYYRLFPRRGMEVDALARFKLARAIAFSVTFFVIILYVPALLRSGWFWTTLSEMGKNTAAVRDFSNSLLNNIEPLVTTDELWLYSLSQILASALMVFGAWGLARTTRRVRK